MYSITVPKWLRLFAPPTLIWEVSTREKIMYLTFDDGPTPYLSNEILAVLRDFKARATFFCVGENALTHPHILERYKAEGHQLGNHTFNHLNGWKTPVNEYLQNVRKTAGVFETPFFRPPYGKIRRKQAKSLHEDYFIIMWSVLTGDFDPKITKEKCLQNAIDHAKKGSIIVFHDNEKTREKVLYALPGFLRYYTDKGYRMEALDKKLFEK